MSQIIWGDALQVRLPEWDVCFTSPPYDMDVEDVTRATERIARVAKPGAIAWIMHPEIERFSGAWEVISHCVWCMTESPDVDVAYAARGPIEATHDIWLVRHRDEKEHYWHSQYRMPNWLAGAPPQDEANYLQVPQNIVTECLGASMPSEGKVFLDPFCGRGNTTAAAHAMGFDATGVEINEEACKQARLKLNAADVQLPSEKHERKVYSSA